MATTNKQIMMMYRLENGIPEDMELYTYGVWKTKGYQVKKGEVCKHRVALWKHNERKKKNDDGTETSVGYCFGKTMYLFTRDQVEEIKK